MAFKVGDKVVNNVYGKGEIVYGPYDGETYFFKREDGRHYTVSESLCKPAAKFKVGDRVKSFAATYTVEAGPFFAPAEWYAVKSDRTGGVMHSTAEELSLVTPEPAKDEPVKVGDVVCILEDEAFNADVKAGDLFEVKALTSNIYGTEKRIKVDAAPGSWASQWTFRPQDFEKVPADKVAVVDGKVYDLNARYRDRDGDYWTFQNVDGTVRGYCAGSDRDMSHMIDSESDTLERAARTYGPLVRV